MTPWLKVVLVLASVFSAGFVFGAAWGGRRNASTDDDLAVSERVNTLLRQQLAEAVHGWANAQQRINCLELRLGRRARAVVGAN